MPKLIHEALPAAGATAVEGKPGRFLLQLISPGWGSAGYYSPQVVEAAAGPTVFPAGTHCYLDHPSASEERDRPERSVRDLAAVLAEDAYWDSALKSLVAEAEVFAPYREPLNAQKGAIGVSIRATAEVEQGEAEGRRGTIVSSLVEGLSADFVTHAGRGGKILQVLESARTDEAFTPEVALAQLAEARNVGQWIESRLHYSLTTIADDMFGDGRLTREERIALSSAVGEALTSFVTSLEGSAPQLYSRDLWEDPGVIAAAVDEATKNVLAGPAGRTTEESKEDPMPQIEETRLRQLEADAGRVTAAESARDEATARAEKAEATLAEANRGAAVTAVITQALEGKGVEFDALQLAGLKATVPTKESGDPDLEKFKTTVEAEVKKLVEAKASTEQVVTRFGGPPATATEAQAEKQLAEANESQRAAMFGRTVKGA